MSEMQPSPSREATTSKVRLWLFVSLAAVLVLALPSLSNPIGRDQATYCVIGRGLLHGRALYKDLWDNKPPGIFFIFAFIVKLFGPVMWSVGLVDILWLLVISIFIFHFTGRTLGVAAAVLAAVVNAAWHTSVGYWDTAQPETFLMLCVFGSYFLLARGERTSRLRPFGSGALFAAAFWIKYNAAAFLPFLLLVPFLDLRGLDSLPRVLRLKVSPRRWRAAALWFTAGCAALSAIVLGYFVLAHSWPAFVEEQFVVLPRYSRLPLERTPQYGLWALGRVRQWLGLWTMGAFVVAAVVSWKRRRLGAAAPILFGAASGLLALALQLRYQPYYFETCFPFFAMVWAYLATESFHGFQKLAALCTFRRWTVARVLVWLVFANLVALSLPGPAVALAVHYKALAAWHGDRERFYRSYAWPGAAEHFRDALRVIRFLDRHPAPPDGVYVWGNEPLIYFLSGHRPPTRFVWNLELIAPWSLPEWRPELMRDLARARPSFIVVARNDEVHTLSYTDQDSEQALGTFPALRDFISGGYREVENDVTFTIYGRR